jgi:AcrR family transcriptional regulator
MSDGNRRGRARRKLLIETALVAFAAHGFRGVSLATIAKQAGISEPGLIHHFPTKAELLLAVIEHYEARSMEVLSEVMEGAGSYADALVALAASHEADPTFIRLFTVLAAESVEPGHPAHSWFVARYERVRSGIAETFRAEQRAGRIAPDLDAELLARQVIALFDGIQLQFLLAGGELDLVTPLRALLDSWDPGRGRGPVAS